MQFEAEGFEQLSDSRSATGKFELIKHTPVKDLQPVFKLMEDACPLMVTLKDCPMIYDGFFAYE